MRALLLPEALDPDHVTLFKMMNKKEGELAGRTDLVFVWGAANVYEKRSIHG
jgi:hypothetical protein